VSGPTIDDRLRLALELLSSVPYIKVGSIVTLPPCIVTDPSAVRQLCGWERAWTEKMLDSYQREMTANMNSRLDTVRPFTEAANFSRQLA
jgi:hypothetical protein